jgi:site-specific DNA-cytosine methylase
MSETMQEYETHSYFAEEVLDANDIYIPEERRRVLDCASRDDACAVAERMAEETGHTWHARKAEGFIAGKGEFSVLIEAYRPPDEEPTP